MLHDGVFIIWIDLNKGDVSLKNHLKARTHTHIEEDNVQVVVWLHVVKQNRKLKAIYKKGNLFRLFFY